MTTKHPTTTGGKVRQERSIEREKKKFVNGLLVRNEAAVAKEQGKLPEGATHELVLENNGVAIVSRRFSLG